MSNYENKPNCTILTKVNNNKLEMLTNGGDENAFIQDNNNNK